jgi:hypothetical protein
MNAATSPKESRGWLLRLTARLLPPHRKEWGDAMHREIDAIESPRAARAWARGCAWAALTERIAYEMEIKRMSRKLLKVLLASMAMLIVVSTGILIDSKPYQRERMRLELMALFGHDPGGR